MRAIRIISAVVLFPVACLLQAQESYSGRLVAEQGAWCWFADPRALYYENASGTIKSAFIGYIDVHGAIKAVQYDYVANTANEILIRSYFQPDDHNNPTFLVLPDERIMIFYSRHTDEKCFYYRISRKPGDITTLGEEKMIVTDHNTTYPSPFILTDDPGHIYLCWRGINWHPTIGRLTLPDENDDVAFDWKPKQLMQSTGARPYAKYASNGKNKIYLTYTTGHPDNENPNFIYFNGIDIAKGDTSTISLVDVKGKRLALINQEVYRINKTDDYVINNPDVVADHSASRNWIWQLVMDEDEKPVIAMVGINDEKTVHDYYVVRWTGSAWQKTFLTHGGGHFHQTPGLEMCYSGGLTIDPNYPDQIYCSVPVDGMYGRRYEIVKYTVGRDGSIAEEPVTRNSPKNNIRPWAIPGLQNHAANLVWMYGDYYDWIVSADRPQGYPTAIHGHVLLPVIEKQTKEITFSLSIPYEDYQGPLCRLGDELEYGLAAMLKPYVKIGNKVHYSINTLGTSDNWQQANRRTDGNWYPPVPLHSFQLTLTYDKEILTTCINGLLDQRIEIPDGFVFPVQK